MTPSSDSRFRARSESHRFRAESYREDANLLLTQYGKPDSAGALLYESAKQCINAAATWNGQNPGPTGAKTRYLDSFAERPSIARFRLSDGWAAALSLHIHADRGHLTESDFRRAWLLAQTFIANMLSIYHLAG